MAAFFRLYLGNPTTTPPVAATPFYKTDWPNPLLRVSYREYTHLTASPLNLRSQDRFFGAAGQVPVYDWPVPNGYVGPIGNRTHVDPLKLNLLGKDQFYGAPGQVIPNTDWPAPAGPRPGPVTNRTHADPLKLSLLGQDKFYGAAGQVPPNTNWPVPPGAQPGPIGNRTHLDPIKLDLLNQDTFYGAAGQPPDYPPFTIPAQADARPQLRFWAVNLLESTLGNVAPFALYEWPLSPGRPFPVGQRTYLDPLKLNLLSLDQFYGAPGQVPPNTDWPAPAGPQPGPITNRTHADLLKLNLLGQDTFYGAAGQVPPNTDWPVPPGALPGPIVNRTHLDPLKLSLRSQDAFFGAAGETKTYEWPLPLGARIGVPGLDPPNLLGSLLQNLYPFSLNDWPVPRGIVGAPLLLDLPNLLGTTLLAYPFVQYEWPLPVRTVVGTLPQSPPNLAVATLAVPVSFAGLEWPNPDRRFSMVPVLAAQFNQSTPPSPPGSGSAFNAPFIVNLGTMMGRRGGG